MICFAWSGLPHYAAAGVAAFARVSGEQIKIVATRPDVPQTVPDILEGVEIKWIDKNCTTSIADIVGDYPSVLVESGWYVPAFMRFIREVKDCGGRVIGMCDHRHTGGVKELARAIRFRLKFKRIFDGILVPGKSGKRLMRWYGMPHNRVADCLYTADNTIFNCAKPIQERSKTILYVGRFDERKNVIRLIETFLNSGMYRNGWKLRCVGQGHLLEKMRHLAGDCDQFEILPFAQPAELSAYYNDARLFVLPSLEDHWGVVVHEAALCGCALALSENVGAAEDFLEIGENGFSFVPSDIASITNCFDEISSWDDAKFIKASKTSVMRAEQFVPQKFASNLKMLIDSI